MCGIAALAGATLPPARAGASLAALRHRGPDMDGQWRDEVSGVWLGHRRLSIVDVSECGRQPLLSEDGRVALVCNGEVYNAPALRRQLEGHGHRFVSRSDSEVIVHGYEQWGDGCLHRLEGMFAFVLWDARRRVLWAARDRAGIKPLYFAQQGGGVALASEVRGLWPLLKAAPALDLEALAQVMARGYVPAPGSMWRGVHKLGPGESLRWEPGRPVQRETYWQPPDALDDDHPGEAAWPALWHDVLRDHLLSDVPLGLFLSGGMDSASVAAGLAEAGHRLHAMTLAFPGSPRDEAPIARQLAQHLGLPLTAWDMTAHNLAETWMDTLADADEPQGLSAVLSMDAICARAAQTHKVVFSGDGGDEVHGGYAWYQSLGGAPAQRPGLRHRMTRRWHRFTNPKKSWVAAGEALSSRSVLHRHAWRQFPRFLPGEIEQILRPAGVAFGEDQLIAPLGVHDRPSLPLRRRLQRIDLLSFCCDSVLAKVDRASMAHSLEVRVPMLDRRVIEFGLSLPQSPPGAPDGEMLKPTVQRYLRGRVPSSVLDHAKQGFSVPLIKTLDADAMASRIGASALVSEGLFGPAWGRLTGPGTPARHARLFVLMSLCVWYDRWPGSVASPGPVPEGVPARMADAHAGETSGGAL